MEKKIKKEKTKTKEQTNKIVKSDKPVKSMKVVKEVVDDVEINTLTNITEKVNIEIDEPVVVDSSIEYTNDQLLYLQYKHIVDSAIDKGVVRIKYNDLMIIRKHIQQKTNTTQPVDSQCMSCVINLLKKFRGLYPELNK